MPIVRERSPCHHRGSELVQPPIASKSDKISVIDRVVVEADDPKRWLVFVDDLWTVGVAEQQPAPSALPVRCQRLLFLVQYDGTDTPGAPLCFPIHFGTRARQCDSNRLSSRTEKCWGGTVMENALSRSRATLEAVREIEEDVTEYEDAAPGPSLWRCGRDCARRRASADKSDHAQPAQGFQFDPPLLSQRVPMSWKAPGIRPRLLATPSPCSA